ncbi:MAG: hypothetical protein ABF868_12145 [Sporolactobacillus sp.]
MPNKHDVSASCLHIQLKDVSLIVGAGMRMHGDDLLPSAGLLDGLSNPAASTHMLSLSTRCRSFISIFLMYRYLLHR